MFIPEALRDLACMENEANIQLRSTKELAKAAYKYFASRTDVASQISIAVALMNLCQTLMKLSKPCNTENTATQGNFFFGTERWEDKKFPKFHGWC